jgi:hypothetical protein
MNSPHRHERNRQAEKQGQLKLNQFGDSIKGNRNKVIEQQGSQRRSYNYMNKHLIQQPLGQPYHKGHRYLFVFGYEGQQPILGADSTSTFGRYGTTIKARFNYSEDKAIVFSLPHSLLIWVKHPSGSRTAEELVQARQTARQVADSFSRKHGIAITSEKEAGFSEHTVENKPLDSLIRPLPAEEPKLAKERLGLSINHTSHKNRVEWTGKSAKERVIGLEHLLDDPITKSDMKELLDRFVVDFVTELRRQANKPEQEAPTRPYEGNEYV